MLALLMVVKWMTSNAESSMDLMACLLLTIYVSTNVSLCVCECIGRLIIVEAPTYVMGLHYCKAVGLLVEVVVGRDYAGLLVTILTLQVARTMCFHHSVDPLVLVRVTTLYTSNTVAGLVVLLNSPEMRRHMRES